MRFIILSDSKGRENGINKKVLIKILNETRKLSPSPEFILLCGDSVAGKTVFYVDYADTRLIILNAFHFNEINKIVKRQLSWFEEAASIDKKNKFVFVHSPAFPTGAHFGHCLDLYPIERDAFWKIAEDCNIDIVFSGHEHNYSRRKIGYKKGINQVITGGSGEKLRDKFKDKTGVVIAPLAKYHFVVVDVDSYGIKVSAISSDGKPLDMFKIDK